MKIQIYKVTEKSFKIEYKKGDEYWKNSIWITMFGYWILIFLPL